MICCRSFVLSTVVLTLGAVPLARAQGPVKATPAVVLEPEPPLIALPRLELTATDMAFAARIEASTEYFGLVLLADSPQVQHFLVDLPPLLVNPVVMGMGKSIGGVLKFSLPRPPDLDFTVYGQAVILDHRGLSSTEPVAVESAPTRG